MAIYYVDLENGNDANNGLSFANRKKTIPANGVAGDEIRVMGSLPPTTIGQCGWKAFESTSLQTAALNTVNRQTPVIITTGANHGFNTGDYVYLSGTYGTDRYYNKVWKITKFSNTQFTLDGSVDGFGGTTALTGTAYRVNHRVVELPANTVKTVAATGPTASIWIQGPSANGIGVSTTNTRSGPYSVRINYPNPTQIGILAYYTLPQTLDLSAYDAISFCIIDELTGAQGFQIRLCSDSVGAVPVNTLTIGNSYTAYTNQQTAFHVQLNNGAPLGSAINSISIYNPAIQSTYGSAIYIENIVAFKSSASPDCVSHATLIGTDPTNAIWHGIERIEDDFVILEHQPTTKISQNPTLRIGNADPNANGLLTTYARQPIRYCKRNGLTFNGTNVYFNTSGNFTGNSVNPILVTGGWDRTSMTTRNLVTYIDGVSGYYQSGHENTCFRFVSRSYINIEGFGLTRYGSAFEINDSSYMSLNVEYIGSARYGRNMVSSTNSSNIDIVTKTNQSIYCPSYSTFPICVDSTWNMGNVFSCEFLILCVGDGTVYSNIKHHLTPSSFVGYLNSAKSTYIYNYRRWNPGNSTVSFSAGNTSSLLYINGFEFLDGGLATTNLGTPFVDTNTARVYISNFVGFPGGVLSYPFSGASGGGRGFLTLDSTVTQSGSGTSCKLLLKGVTGLYGARMSLAKVGCSAGLPLTVGVWLRKDSTNVGARLFCRGGQISGISSDVSAIMTAGINTWELVQLNLSPSVSGVIEIELHASSSVDNGILWFDNLTIT